MAAMNVGPTATKKTVLEQLLEQGMVLVALDARVHGVDVPTHLGKDPQLRLNLSYRFGLPMTVEDWGVAATLTFAGVPYSCRFPWAAIFLLVSHVSGQPYLFPDDIPAELLSQAPEMAASMVPRTSGSAAGESERPKLTLISSKPVSPEETKLAAPVAAAVDHAEGAAAAAKPPRTKGERRVSTTTSKRKNARQESSASPLENETVDVPPATNVELAPSDDPSAASDQDNPRPQRPRRRGHLRLVK